MPARLEHPDVKRDQQQNDPRALMCLGDRHDDEDDARYDSAGKRQPVRGKVIAVDARNGKVKVEGAGLVKKHVKPVPQMNREGGIREQEAWIDVSNVALIDPDTGKPTRVKYEVRDGNKVRVAKSGKVIPVANVFGKKEPKKDKEKA
jgi:large subunit ribosomal protein L24